jgi:hypothetical protein
VLLHLANLDTAGLQRCRPDHHSLCEAGLLPCDQRQVEHRLGRPVDPDHPDDVAIGIALQLEEEDRAYAGSDRRAIADEAYERDLISREEWLRRLANEDADRAARIEEAKTEILRAHRRTSRQPPPSPTTLNTMSEEFVTRRERRERGELPRKVRVRVSKTSRVTLPTFELPPFTVQMGRLAHERDPPEIARLVRELRRQAKQHGFLPPDHDKRPKH